LATAFQKYAEGGPWRAGLRDLFRMEFREMKMFKWRKWMLLASGLAVYQVAGCNTLLTQYQQQIQTIIHTIFPGSTP